MTRDEVLTIIRETPTNGTTTPSLARTFVVAGITSVLERVEDAWPTDENVTEVKLTSEQHTVLKAFLASWVPRTEARVDKGEISDSKGALAVMRTIAEQLGAL